MENTIMDQLADLPFVPKWLGYPMYPAGFPVQPDAFSIATEVDGESTTIRERIAQYYAKCFTPEGELLESPPLSEDDFQVLRQWVIYVLHAPIWTLHGVPEFNALKLKSLRVSTWADLDEVGFEALGLGLDFL